MIEERFKLPVIDFVSRADEVPNLVGVVLYGSAVTGDVSKKSDIDLLLLFDCDHDPELGEEASIAHGISSDVSLKHDLAFPFSFVFVNLRELKEIESDFLWKNKLLDKKTDRLGPGTILVIAEKFEDIRELFDKFHVKYSLKKVWGH